MNRREHLRSLAILPTAALPAAAVDPVRPIQLHVDLEVDPAREKEMVSNFEKTFRPAIRKQPGFVDVRLLRLRTALAGKAPANCGYRLLISFQTEEQRKAWVATDTHQQVWPTIERTLRGAKYTALLYDAV
jgi:heme-degrading monooxygenase HmoA